MRVTATEVVVHSAPQLETYPLQNVARVGGFGHARWVDVETAEATSTAQRRSAQQVDAAYRAWMPNRSDVGRQREIGAF